MNAVLLDTHIALWLDSGDRRLRASTRALIDNAWRSGGDVLLSAVTAWEIAQLVSTGRIALDCRVDDWMDRFLDQPGVRDVPLTYRAAVAAYHLDDLEHRDPADRLLMASAIELACPLIAYDTRIIQFANAHGSRYGFGVAS